MPTQVVRYVRGDEFFESATATDIQERVTEEIRAERKVEMVDKDLLRQQEDWGFLANKIVGAEGT